MDLGTKLRHYFAKEKTLTAGIILFGILTNVLIIWIPTFQGRLIDSVATGVTGNFILRQISIFIALVTMVQLFRFFKRYLVRKFENRITMAIRKTIFHNIINSSREKISAETVGSLMNKIIGDVSIVAEGLRKIITEIFDTGIMLFGYFLLMAANDFKLTLLSCMFIPLAVFLSQLLKNIVVCYNRKYREAKSKLNDTIYQNVTHALLFRSYGLQDEFNQAFKHELPNIRKKAVRAAFFATGLEPLYNAISLAGIIFCIYYGAGNIEKGFWTIGQFLSFMIMYTAVAGKSGKISTYINLWQKTAVSWQRLKTHLISSFHNPGNKEDMQLTKPLRLKFNQVSFGYCNQQMLLNNLTFAASTGEIIGVCGPIASGKTTLLKLMSTENHYLGKITVNDTNLSALNLKQKSHFIAFKNHDAELFAGSIAENIAFDSGIPLHEVLIDACLTEDLRVMPDGIQTLVGRRGTTLSGGQNDRIALARTLLEHKDIILLDDPFSAVDADTENKLIQNLRKNYQDSIVVLTSHRFTIFPYVDKVICLDGKGGHRMGTHEELMESHPLYRQVYFIQRGSA